MDKGLIVRRMFSRISSGYDLMNRILSFGLDRSWRRRTVELVVRPGSSVLDVGTGTGDMVIEIIRQMGDQGHVVGVDFCEEMIARARRKVANRRLADRCEFVIGDALDLPFPEDTFDVITTAFALRNVADLGQALREFRRVLKPGGKMAILDLGRPVFLPFKMLYYTYFFGLVPLLGTLNRGSLSSYFYLPRSLLTYPPQEQLAELIVVSGFHNVEYTNLAGGIVSVHVGVC